MQFKNLLALLALFVFVDAVPKGKWRQPGKKTAAADVNKEFAAEDPYSPSNTGECSFPPVAQNVTDQFVALSNDVRLKPTVIFADLCTASFMVASATQADSFNPLDDAISTTGKAACDLLPPTEAYNVQRLSNGSIEFSVPTGNATIPSMIVNPDGSITGLDGFVKALDQQLIPSDSSAADISDALELFSKILKPFVENEAYATICPMLEDEQNADALALWLATLYQAALGDDGIVTFYNHATIEADLSNAKEDLADAESSAARQSAGWPLFLVAIAIAMQLF